MGNSAKSRNWNRKPLAIAHCSLQYPCEYCDKVFRAKNSYYNHVNIHKGKTLCYICNKHLSTVSNLKAHMAQKHPEIRWSFLFLKLSDADLPSNVWGSGGWHSKLQFACEICFKSFSNKKSLQNHAGIHKGKTTCTVCNTVFSTTSNLNFHMRKIHNSSVTDFILWNIHLP